MATAIPSRANRKFQRWDRYRPVDDSVYKFIRLKSLTGPQLKAFLSIQTVSFPAVDGIAEVLADVRAGRPLEPGFTGAKGYVLVNASADVVVGGFLLDTKGSGKNTVFLLYNVAVGKRFRGRGYSTLLNDFAATVVNGRACIAEVEMCNHSRAVSDEQHRENVSRLIRSYSKRGFIIHELTDGALSKPPYAWSGGAWAPAPNFTTQTLRRGASCAHTRPRRV